MILIQKMHNLTVGNQQMCEISSLISPKAEAMSSSLTEPSAALTEKRDCGSVLSHCTFEKRSGHFIFPRMVGDVVTDRVLTVMRDGGYSWNSYSTKDIIKEDIIKHDKLGRVIYEESKRWVYVCSGSPVVLKSRTSECAVRWFRICKLELQRRNSGFSGLIQNSHLRQRNSFRSKQEWKDFIIKT